MQESNRLCSLVQCNWVSGVFLFLIQIYLTERKICLRLCISKYKYHRRDFFATNLVGINVIILCFDNLCSLFFANGLIFPCHFYLNLQDNYQKGEVDYNVRFAEDKLLYLMRDFLNALYLTTSEIISINQEPQVNKKIESSLLGEGLTIIEMQQTKIS